MSFQSAYSGSEAQELAYIKQCGEMGIATIVDTWLDSAGIDVDDQPALRTALNTALTSHLAEIEIAEAAAQLVGNPDFESWMDDQE